jgi:DNA repair exonuclease SbcCD nuclease subunit
MSELRFISSSDEHCADLNIGFRKDNYREAIFSKLVWQGEMLQKFNANAMLRGGDFWHVKAANKTTMASLVRAVGIHRRYSCPTHAIAGNHDMSSNDLESIDRQPLGVMLKSGVFKGMNNVFEDGSMRVRIIGVDYTTDLAEDGLCELVKKRDDTSNYTIAFVHALAEMKPSDKIQSFFHEKVFDYRDLVFEGCPDVYVFGHYHKDQGIREHLGVKFVNLGAIARGALTFENLERKPKVSLIKCNSQGISIEECIVPHADAAQVFDLERKKKLDLVRHDMDEFITQLRSGASRSTSDAVHDRIALFQKSADYPSDMKKLMTEVMEAAEAGLVEE